MELAASRLTAELAAGKFEFEGPKIVFSNERMELMAYDAGLRARTASSVDRRIVIIDESEDDLLRFGHPLSDEILAKLIERTVALGARVVGIDVSLVVGFLFSVNEPRDRVASLTTNFKISCDTLCQLQDEVHAYWSSRDMVLSGSRFRE